MALSARIGNAREGGRKTKNAAATGRFAARGRTACFTPRRQGKNGHSGGSTGTRRCTAAAHSPQKKTSEEVFYFLNPQDTTPRARVARRKGKTMQIDLETGEILEDG